MDSVFIAGCPKRSGYFLLNVKNNSSSLEISQKALKLFMGIVL